MEHPVPREDSRFTCNVVQAATCRNDAGLCCTHSGVPNQVLPVEIHVKPSWLRSWRGADSQDWTPPRERSGRAHVSRETFVP